jgi:putative OmpL-like beta-barrel porin-2
MKVTSRYRLTLVTALAVLGFGASLSPVSRAQASPQTQAPDKNAQQSADSAASKTVSPDQDSSSSAQQQLTVMASPEPEPQAAQSSTPPASGSTSSQDQTAATPPAAPTPLPTPSMSAPLSTAAPAHTFDAGPFGTLSVTGILSGMGLVQDNWVPGDKSSHWDLSNAQIFVQKTTGWWQFYFQGGAYNIPDLGLPYLSTNKTLSNWFGPLPVGFVKFVKGGFSAEVGALPTLIGAEYTFDFENLNIERGLLWNQENAVNKGIQLNEAYKKVTLSFSWNDGFYSNRYTWLSGSFAYALNAANTISFVAGGNAGATKYTTFASPIINNSAIYEVLYTYAHGNWYIEPYWQYTNLPKNNNVGVTTATSTDGVALLFNYNFKGGISVALRPEYITSSGSLTNGAVNLLYGPGSNAFSFTFTPTYQKGGFFLRADLGVVDARSFTPGDAFGALGTKGTQTRGAIEAGFMF